LNKNKQKKGQSTAGSAATLLAIIAGLILLYILFLPPQEREELLGSSNASTQASGEEAHGNETLLLEHPGVIEYVAETEVIHNIPSVNLRTEPVSKILKKVLSAEVKRSWFSREDLTINFKAEDLKNLQNIVFSMNIIKGRGELTITLNGEKIYSSDSKLFQPITLDKGSLAEDNVIVVSVSPPGWAFWLSNKYEIKDAQVIAEVIDTSLQESKNTFIVSSSEKNSLKEAFLRFYPSCDKAIGKVVVSLNNHEIYSAVPDCNVANPSIQISPQYILSGENLLVFKTEKGNYLIDQISIKAKLKESTNPTYFFNIEEDVYNDIINNSTKINLTMEFVDDLEKKEAKIVINGYETGINQYERIYTKRINAYVRKGNNAVEIIPKTTLKILELKVFLW